VIASESSTQQFIFEAASFFRPMILFGKV